MMCRKSDEKSIDLAVECLKKNEVVVLPTDTVYGFSGMVGPSENLIKKIKGRDEKKPFIQLIASCEDISKITDDSIPEDLKKYWPGPLTIIVHDKLNPEKTVAVRCPGDKWLRTIIEKAGKPIYSTSVNRSGSPVLQKIEDIKKEFENEVKLIIDDGDSKSGVPSTIVALSDDSYKVIRKGAIEL